MRIAGQWLASGQWLPGRTLPAVLLTGVLAIVIACPGFLLLDILFEPYVVDLNPEPKLGWPLQLQSEIVELTPWFMVAWMLINLPALIPAPTSQTGMNDPMQQAVAPSQTHDTEASVLHHAEATCAEMAVQPDNIDMLEPQHDSHGKASPQAPDTSGSGTPELQFLRSLPGVVGTDIIAVSSDLHYLNVWTATGRSTVPGSLRNAVTELGDTGMQVHRSHWLSHAHVSRIVGNASNTACILSNGLRVPISRRKWKAVREQYGSGVVHRNHEDLRPK